MTGEEAASLADVVEELQNVRVDVAALAARVPTRFDMMAICGVLLLLVGVVIGVGVGLVIKGWFQ